MPKGAGNQVRFRSLESHSQKGLDVAAEGTGLWSYGLWSYGLFSAEQMCMRESGKRQGAKPRQLCGSQHWAALARCLCLQRGRGKAGSVAWTLLHSFPPLLPKPLGSFSMMKMIYSAKQSLRFLTVLQLPRQRVKPKGVCVNERFCCT